MWSELHMYGSDYITTDRLRYSIYDRVSFVIKTLLVSSFSKFTFNTTLLYVWSEHHFLSVVYFGTASVLIVLFYFF